MAEWKPFDLKWGRSIWYCSACEESTEVPTYLGTPMYNFCPMCGANMNMKKADGCKTESNSEFPNNCDTCKHNKLEWYSEVCDGCSKAHSNYEPQDDDDTNGKDGYFYEPKDEPKTDMAEDIVRSYGFKAESYQQAKAKDEPQPMTDAEITELAKEIVHKMIDNSVIAEDAYPDLKQRMHEAVERLDEYYPSEDERSDQ